MTKLRRTMMFVPGNKPALINSAHIYGSDSLMFDLEDSIAVTEKDSARFLVYHALTTLDFNGIETVVRINNLLTIFGEEDLKAIVKAKPNIIRLPKTENAADVKYADDLITKWEQNYDIKLGSIKLFAAIETALGVLNAREIATASNRLVGMAIGAEDFVTDMKTNRSPEGTELFAARSMIVLAAKAAGIAAVDTVFTNIDDDEGLKKETILIKQLGFDGKSVINPRQIDIVHQVFTPTSNEIAKANRIIKAYEEAIRKNSGVFALDGRMIDKPIVDRAYYVISLAKASGISPV